MAGKYLKTPEKLYDPNEAVALSKLVRSSIQRRLKELPNLRKEAYQEIFAKYPEAKGFTQGKLQQLLKQNNYDLYRVIKDLPSEQKALRRGLAEFLTTDPNFFDRKGLLDLFSKDLSKLEGKELMKTLKGWDNALSGYKDSTGKVGHHTTLSALTDLMSSVDEKWRLDFNKLAELDGFNIGDEGLIKIAPGVHKPFDTVPGKNTRLVKGKLAETLSKFLPDAKFEKGRLHIVGGVNPKVDAILDQLAGISTHGEWAGGTVGFKVPPNLKDLSPSEAYKVARNTLGAEKAIAAHGIKLDKNLNNYLSKSNFNTLDELTEGLSSKFRQPNWQPPNIKDTLIKEVDIALGQATAAKPLDVLDQPGTKRVSHLLLDAIESAKDVGTKISNIPGVKPTLEVANVVRKNPVVSTVLSAPVISGVIDASESIAAGTDLLKDDYEGKRAKLEKTSDEFKFMSGSTGLASLRFPLLAPTSLISGAVHLLLENRIKREEKRDKRIENFLNPPNFGQTEIKHYDPYEGISTL